MTNLDVRRGHPLPLGSRPVRGGVNFAVFSCNAAGVTLVLFRPGSETPFAEIPLDRRLNRTGDIWHAFIAGLDPDIHYGYRMQNGPGSRPQLFRFDPGQLLIDPYARAVAGKTQWGDAPNGPRRGIIVEEDGFDWGLDQPLNTPLSDTVIYEMHVRGFTRHPSSGVANGGTFRGVIEKIPYLRELGVTAVELLPVHEFEEVERNRFNPFSGQPLVNLWGYQPLAFFAPNAAYAAAPGEQIREFKQLVKALHAAGIEIILDVVFNHTGEGDLTGPTVSFRGIDNPVYYIVDPITGKYIDFSGCGNTLNCNHPVVRELIADCLRYWVTEMHVDGFRFDLASILGRGRDGSVLANPPLLETLAYDPVLAHTKLIAEAWDAAGLYQVGTFPAWSRWAEWNGKFRDDVRRFVRGDEGMVTALATRLAGSPDLYQTSSREPYHSINFVTCHDGFTLADLISYNDKHNEANGLNNTDGANDNWSWNCGVEGPTADPAIAEFRERQVRNFAAILLLAEGVPMLLAGDEFGRSQRGNNNAYCQDNDISWIDWNLAESNSHLLRFFRLLIAFRRQHPLLRTTSYESRKQSSRRRLEWHGIHLGQPDWGFGSRSLAMHVSGISAQGRQEHLYFVANAYSGPLDFELPQTGLPWRRFLDTALLPPREITESDAEEAIANAVLYRVEPRSVVVLTGRGSQVDPG